MAKTSSGEYIFYGVLVLVAWNMFFRPSPAGTTTIAGDTTAAGDAYTWRNPDQPASSTTPLPALADWIRDLLKIPQPSSPDYSGQAAMGPLW